MIPLPDISPLSCFFFLCSYYQSTNQINFYKCGVYTHEEYSNESNVHIQWCDFGQSWNPLK